MTEDRCLRRRQDHRPLRPGSLAVARTGLRVVVGLGAVTVVVLVVVTEVVLVVCGEGGAAVELQAESDSSPKGP